ncbi:sulfonate transport system permease protein [Rhodobacter viridis]|uniref:Sulfonate transport system permease protein n=1 Tax=Rhodobacter viridis TaxID=1054202 RepID=A0A318U2L1_9RHOB|nr:ABC transporter permease [Rhodobacter viridis]PYF12700.1 sulfonate transport system permease protein [Rhodobacter viridis]
MAFQGLEISVTPVARPDGPPPPLSGANLRRGLEASARLATRYGLLLGFLGVWQVASTAGWLNPSVFPPLDRIVTTLAEGILSGALLDDIAISLQRAGIAFAASVAVGVPLGLAMGQMPVVERALDPILQLFRQTSALALYPVFILLLGLGETSKVFVIFWASLFPILLATIGGVKQVDGKLLEMARSFGAGRLTLFGRVILPAAVPAIFVGLRLSGTTALLLLIAAEMIGANKGLGFQVMNAQFNFRTDLMFAAIFLLAFIGLALNAALVAAQARFCRWSEPR